MVLQMYFIRNIILRVSQSNNNCQPDRSSPPSSVNANKYDGDANKGWVSLSPESANICQVRVLTILCNVRSYIFVCHSLFVCE